MLNEIAELKAYTETPVYKAEGKRDTTYMGRFTFATLTQFDGMGRILTIIARGYLHRNNADPYSNIEYARRALCAWCSVPEKSKKAPEDRTGPDVNFGHLSSEFPELVDEKGCGWLCRHVQRIVQFVRLHPDITSKSAAANCKALAAGFTKEWKKKLRQMQVPAFAVNTRGAWVLRFDDILADALELGPLKSYEVSLSEDVMELLSQMTPDGVPDDLLPELLRYYRARRQEEGNWVVLPVSAWDAYCGGSSFSKKWKSKLPKDIIEFQNSYGVCKFKMTVE